MQHNLPCCYVSLCRGEEKKNILIRLKSDPRWYLLYQILYINCSMKLQPWVVWLCVNSFSKSTAPLRQHKLIRSEIQLHFDPRREGIGCQWRASRNNLTRHTDSKLIITENNILTDGELAASLGGDLIIIQLLLPFLCKFYKMARVPNLRSGPARRTSDMTNRFSRSNPAPLSRSAPNKTQSGLRSISQTDWSIRLD